MEVPLLGCWIEPNHRGGNNRAYHSSSKRDYLCGYRLHGNGNRDSTFLPDIHHAFFNIAGWVVTVYTCLRLFLDSNGTDHLMYWRSSLTNVRVLIGLPINPLLVMSFNAALSSAITEAVTKTIGISCVLSSRRNILAAS